MKFVIRFSAWLYRFRYALTGVLLALVLIFFGVIRPPGFSAPYSKVLYGSAGNLMAARVAADEQWRFPPADSLPPKYVKALLAFEDKRFFMHPGVDVLAMGRALMQNLSKGKVVSGGSTISMQVVRLSRQQPRTLREKLIESVLALRLEAAFSKEDILLQYASHAPYGGNVVGINAAAWRYLGHPLHELSWAEAAMLAVLPNNPGLIHPGRDRQGLRQKRNALLLRLYHKGEMDSLSYRLALDERLPRKPKDLPSLAPHLLNTLAGRHPGKSRFETLLHPRWQSAVVQLLDKHLQRLRGNGIHNIGILVLETETGYVRAYAGNRRQAGRKGFSWQVDVTQGRRSTGSVLKPFLYAAMLGQGQLAPKMWVPDIPTVYAGFMPRNYNLGYDGVVPADRALARSLNIPAVRMLKQYGVAPFHHKLKQIGLQGLNQPPSHYGLSLILGGCEGSLWDLAGMYASMGRVLLHYSKEGGQYLRNDWHPPRVFARPQEEEDRRGHAIAGPPLTAAALWFTLEALKDVERPESEAHWRQFSSTEPVSWKTGTSFGFRDAWAIGLTPRFTIGVWAGNANGDPAPGLVGIQAAAPILFDVLDILPDAERAFPRPEDELVPLPVCRETGYPASPHCPHPDTLLVPETTVRAPNCTFHKPYWISANGKWRLASHCARDAGAHKEVFLRLPAAMAHYYRQHKPYNRIPPWKPGCQPLSQEKGADIQLVYPAANAHVVVPRELSGEKGRVVFELAHSQPKATIFWHLDGEYLGKTTKSHKMALQPGAGQHRLYCVDVEGNELEHFFSIEPNPSD